MNPSAVVANGYAASADGAVPAILPGMQAGAVLHGRDGINRASGLCQLGDCDDLEAVGYWLAQAGLAAATRQNYTKEVRRLLLWCYHERLKPLSSLTHVDMQDYAAFLANPPRDWLAPTRPRVTDPRWRPFAGPMSPGSVRQALLVLNGMFSWLVQARYLAGNPMALTRASRRRGIARARIVRYFDRPLWLELLRTVHIAEPGPESARNRWLLSLLWFGLRITEVGNARMNDVSSERGPDGRLRHWLRVVGKGSKERFIPVTSELLAELARYRTTFGLSALPESDDTRPLVLPLRGTPRIVVRSTLHRAIKVIVRATEARLRQVGDDLRATHIAAASAHWVRHSSGSSMESDAGFDVVSIRDLFGHESIATTNTYMHTEDRRRHDMVEQGHRIGWAELSDSGSIQAPPVGPADPAGRAGR